MSAAPMNSAISAGLAKRLWNNTFDSTPISFANAWRSLAISIPFPAQNVGMSRARDDIYHILVLRQDMRQRLNHVLDSLVRREQAEREEHRFPFHPETIFVEIRDPEMARRERREEPYRSCGPAL